MRANSSDCTTTARLPAAPGLSAAVGGVALSGDPFVVSNGGATSAYVRDTKNRLRQFQAGAGGSWTAWDLTGSAGGVTVSGDPFVLTNSSGVTSVYVRD